ncbi:Palmitoyltransferase zdhhc21, partial [Bonamia ostreae]
KTKTFELKAFIMAKNLLSFKFNNQNWFVTTDYCCLITGNITIALLIFGHYAFVTFVLKPWIGFNLISILHGFFTIMAMMSHIRSQFTDPGDIKRHNKVSDNEEAKNRLCIVCFADKPASVHHCSVCKKCILDMDHHCPWINNCVGYLNQKYFVLFLFYTFLTCAIAI